MALIEIEFLKPTFEASVGFLVRNGPAVPIPTLAPLGDDRLILSFVWQGDPSIEAGFPRFTPPPGTLLLQSKVILTHASVAEIRVWHDTPGRTLTGTAWLLMTTIKNQAIVTLVGFDVGAGSVPLAVPQQLGTLFLPTPEDAGVQAAALVADNAIVTLRFATSALDNLLQPSAHRLLSKPSDNWLIHVPAEFFVGLILDKVMAGLSPPPDGTIVEESPQAYWIQDNDGTWGVTASVGLKKINACPGLFSNVDISVEVTVSNHFVENHDKMRLNIGLIIETNASDWDTFRCWLGSLGIGSLALSLINPFLGVVGAIVSLTCLSENVRSEVGGAAHDLSSINNFTKVSSTTSSVSYSGSAPIEPLPYAYNVDFGLGPNGLDIWGSLLPISPPHVISFNPDHGPLLGTWTGILDCPHQSMDYTFAYQNVLIAESIPETGKGIPVIIWLTSFAEPVGECWIERPAAVANLSVSIKAPGMHAGDAGFVVLHTSAGLRAYALAPLPAAPTVSSLIGGQRTIDLLCKRYYTPLREKPHRLKWVEPPPDFNWGFDPLRQWQIIVQGLPENAVIEVRANTGDGPLLASRANFTESLSRAVIELVTDAETDLVLRTENANAETNATLITRWLLPQHREAFDAPVRAFSKTGSSLMLSTDAGEQSFDLGSWHRSGAQGKAGEGGTRLINRQGQSLYMKPDRVAFIHEGKLVIAMPFNTLTREDA